MTKKKKIIGIVSILLIVGVTVAISGCTSSENGTKVFENQYVKFNYPADWVVVDQSQGNSIEILLFKGKPDKEDSTDPKYVGAIESGDNPTLNLKTVTGSKTIQNINGKNATVYVDQTTWNAVFTLNPQRINGGLYFSLDILQPESVFYSILNSLVIKIETTVTNNTLNQTTTPKITNTTKKNTNTSKNTTPVKNNTTII